MKGTRTSTQAPDLEVLIPTYERQAALAVTLTSLSAQTLPHFEVLVSDQSETTPSWESPEVATPARLLRRQGRRVRFERHLPRRGMAEQRAFLLARSRGRYVLFLDDDLLVEPPVLDRMLRAIRETGAGFVGCAPIGLSYIDDVRPHQQGVELWDGPVEPERIRPGGPGWHRHMAHNAANPLHIEESLELGPQGYVPYKVAWVGGCVLFDAEALRSVGGFGFWRELPAEHAGEDVVAQLRVMERYGGCGVLPSGVYHLEAPTTLPRRDVDAPHVVETMG